MVAQAKLEASQKAVTQCKTVHSANGEQLAFITLDQQHQKVHVPLCKDELGAQSRPIHM